MPFTCFDCVFGTLSWLTHGKYFCLCYEDFTMPTYFTVPTVFHTD